MYPSQIIWVLLSFFVICHYTEQFIQLIISKINTIPSDEFWFSDWILENMILIFLEPSDDDLKQRAVIFQLFIDSNLQ